MLQETYERNYNHNYMIIQAKEREYTGFCEKIIQENKIAGLLPCQFRIIEGILFFYYEISGKRTLSQLFQKKKIGTAEMRRLLTALGVLQKESQRYLLDFQKYILLPEYLYSDFDIEHLYAVYYPDYKGEVFLEKISSFFIEHVDYQEAEAVELAYSFQQRVMEENVSLELIAEELLKEKKIREKGEEIYEKERDKVSFYEEKVREPFYEEKKTVIRKASIFHKEEQKEKWKIGNLACFEEIRNLLKKLNIFKKVERENKRKREKPVYEVELDLDETVKETPFFSRVAPSEATQFFSCQEEPEVHGLVYQGRKDLPNLKLEVFPYIVGKGEKGIDGRLEIPTISRIHSQLDCIDNKYFIMDLNSTNGTFLNGERLPPNRKHSLSPGDRIQFAGETYIFQ